MEINKATRSTLINSAIAQLDTIPALRKSELASGTSYFLNENRVVKIVNTGRLEINVSLTENSALQLSEMNFQDWSNKPRSGVKYYGLATPEAVNVLLTEINPPVKEKEVKGKVKKQPKK